jgi:hypothetical protein
MFIQPKDSEYRAYLLDANDHIIRRYDFEADDSTRALETATQWVDGHDVEVWQRTDIIGRLEHVR